MMTKVKRWDHFIAMTGTLVLHSAVAAWALFPSASAAVPQQVIQVSMVAPSAVQKTEMKEMPQDDPTPVTPPKPDGIKVKKKVEKPKQKPEEVAKKTVVTPPTSGPQAVDAKEKLAAQTDPVFDAAYLHNPPPEYPLSAKRHGVQGKVLLNVAVSKEGSARDVSVATSSGSSLLDEAARDAVVNWRFVPAKRGNEIVEARVIVPVLFKLN